MMVIVSSEVITFTEMITEVRNMKRKNMNQVLYRHCESKYMSQLRDVNKSLHQAVMRPGWGLKNDILI